MDLTQNIFSTLYRYDTAGIRNVHGSLAKKELHALRSVLGFPNEKSANERIKENLPFNKCISDFHV
jgi:hypothetical protein